MFNLDLAAQSVLSLLFGIGLEVLELPRGNMFDEHFVDFLKGTTSCLWLVEKQIDPAKHRKASKDKGSLGSEVGLIGIEDEWQDKLPHCEKCLLYCAGNGDGLSTKPRSCCLGNNGVCNGSDGEIVGEVVENC
jgi:hypothetical protein